MAGLLLWPLGQLVPVRLTDAHGADFTPPAHPAEGGLADAQGLRGLLGGQLFLLAGRAVEFGDGLFDEVADQVEDTGIGRMLSTPGSGYSLRCVQD